MPARVSRESVVSAAQARRLALAAQGFGKAPLSTVRARDLMTVARRLGVIQIDSVNVLARAHYVPLFSRLGAYDRDELDRLASAPGAKLFEYWAHEASLLPLETYPLLRWRMRRARSGVGLWRHVAQVGRERPDLLERVRSTIAANGPMGASDFGDGERGESWWGWSDTKRAVEFLFWCGELMSVGRRSSFERRYDVPERVLPPELRGLSEMDEATAQRELVAIAARALGVATAADLRDYFRLDRADANARIAELCDAGRLLPVRVEGWKAPAYLDAPARIPRALAANALLSPFDPLVWNRDRTHRLFGFRYRIEIYVPAHRRVHGYYVLPYLFDGELVARVDLKADRATATLRVVAVHYEEGIDRGAVRAALRDDLAKMAGWLNLERVTKIPAPGSRM